MRGLLSATIFYLLSFQSYSQSSNLKKIMIQLDTMADGPVQGHFKNNVLAFSGEVVSGKMSGQWLFWNTQGVIKSNSFYENGKIQTDGTWEHAWDIKIRGDVDISQNVKLDGAINMTNGMEQSILNNVKLNQLENYVSNFHFRVISIAIINILSIRKLALLIFIFGLILFSIALLSTRI